MAKNKPTCPSCGSDTFRICQTFAIKDNCHDLERRRYAYYRCKTCGGLYLLVTPKGRLEKIREGAISEDQAKRVLEALNLPLSLLERLKN